jgi:ABC-type phosphate transport system auxiliary subunit
MGCRSCAPAAIDLRVAANIYQAVKQAMQDLVAPQLESLKGEIGALRAETQGAHATLGTEMQGNFAALRTEMQGNFAALRTEMHALRTEMEGNHTAFRAEMQGNYAALRAEMQGNHAALSTEIRRLDDKLTWALDLRERITALETKVGTGPVRS